MKVATILATVIITLTSCNCQKKTTETTLTAQNETKEQSTSEKNEKMTINQTIPVLIYESMSRGYFKRIAIEKGRVSVQNVRGEEPKTAAITANEMKMLEEAFKGINPKELATLKAPTEKRFYDGAPITNLQVKEGEETFSTSDFDGGFPPAEIKDLVEAILKIADKIK